MAGPKKSRHAAQEFGPGQREFLLCSEGEAVYYKKSWHHMTTLQAAKNIDKKRIAFVLCPAHRMKKDNVFEGEVIIENIPLNKKDQLVRTIRNVGDRAYRADVLDRILELLMKNDEVRVTTTENQLAKKIAKKVKAVYKTASVKYIFSRAGDLDIVRIRITFPQ